MTLFFSTNGEGVRHIEASASKPKTGSTPLKVEPQDGRYALCQYDMRPSKSIGYPRTVLGMYDTELEAERAAAAFADGPPKQQKQRTEKHRGKMAAKLRKQQHAKVMGKRRTA